MTHHTLTPHFAARPLGRSIRSLGCMSLLIAAAITVQSSEATAADIVNVEDFPIKVSHPMAEVELRIKKAGARRGWKMKGVGAGQLEAFIIQPEGANKGCSLFKLNVRLRIEVRRAYFWTSDFLLVVRCIMGAARASV